MAAETPRVSFVIPCYNEVGTVRDLWQQVRAQLETAGVSGEFVFVDDGSTDGTRNVLRELAAEDPLCRVIFFRRNLGKAAALDTAFRCVRGEAVITMDADLQDDPAEIPRFLKALEEFDVVSGWKAVRHDPKEKTLPSKLFNGTVRRVTGIGLHDMNCGFKAYRRAVIDELRLWGELHRYIPVLASARGFTIGELAVTHHPRRSGVSKYGLERYVRGMMDLFTVVFITRYRSRPLHMLGGTGLLMVVLGLCSWFWILLFGWHRLEAPCAGLLAGGLAWIAAGLAAEAAHSHAYRSLPDYPVAERLNCEE